MKRLDHEPIKRRYTYELVAERLLAELASSDFNAGDPIPTERELTERFEVGRSSVREALRMLESRGLIEARGHGNFVVGETGELLRHTLAMLLTLERSDLRELFELRRILEPELAGLAADRRSERDLEALRTALSEMQEGILDRQRMMAADLKFHVRLAEASGNRLALQFVEALRKTVERALTKTYHVAQEAVDQHERILEAVTARDPDAARLEMRAHLDWIETIIDEELTSAHGQ